MAEITYSQHILDVCQQPLPWNSLDHCNILLTGATGLIGNCLLEVLLSRHEGNYNVYALGRNKQRLGNLLSGFHNNPRLHIICSDVTQPLNSVQNFQYIIHAASGAAPADFANHPVEVMKANINGVANLIEYGLAHEMRRFLYVSSGEVYGEGDGRVFNEDYSGYVNNMLPRSCYPSSKRAAETLCVSYAAEYGIDVVVARPCHIYGPHFTESDNRVYAQFIRNVMRGENIVMKSTGEQFRSWCYVVDCVSALLHILLKGKSGEAYNIADATSNTTIRELAGMTAEIGGRQVVMEVPEVVETRGYNPVSTSVFSTKKVEALGWMVKGSMSEKLRATISEKKRRIEG